MSKLSANSVLNAGSLLRLSSVNILSVHDFVQADVEKICANSYLTLADVLRLKDEFVTKYSSEIRNGYETAMSCNLFIKSHIKGIDSLLNGGFKKRSLLEVCGLSGSGKSQFCLTVAVNIARSGGSVYYIDTKSDFSALRCRQILQDEESRALESIYVFETSNSYEMISVLYELENIFKHRQSVENDVIIIIDSITVPYLSFLGMDSNKGISLLGHISSVLKKIAFEYNTAIITTNLGTTFVDLEDSDEVKLGIEQNQEIKPLLGKFWQHIPNTRLTLEVENESQTRRVVVRKSDCIQLGATAYVDILPEGVVSADLSP